MKFYSFVPPINYPSINPPVIRLPDLDLGLGDLGDLFKQKSKDSALTLAKFLVDVNIRTDLKQQLEPLIQEAFDKLESFLKDIAFAAENLLGKSKLMLEDLIKQALKGLAELLTDIEQKVSNILSQAKLLAEGIINRVKIDLLDGFFDRINSLKKELIDDLKKLIQDAKQAGEDLLYKGDTIVTGTIANLKNDIDKLASDLEEQLDIRKWFDLDEKLAQQQEEEREDFCKSSIRAKGMAFSTLGSAQFYEYRQCVTLKRLNDAVELSGGKVTIRNVKLVYADLNDRAWKLACIGRAEGSALQDIALQDWIKFGQLFQLWNQFEDGMELINAINQQMDRLNKDIAAFRAEFSSGRTNMSWTLMYEHDEKGNKKSGDLSTLISKVEQGANVRILIEDNNSQSVVDADIVWIIKGVVFAQNTQGISVHMQPPSGDKQVMFQPDSYHYFIMVNTDGYRDAIRYSVGEHTERGHNQDRVEIKWFVS